MQAHTLKKDSGTSLIEMLVATALGLIVLAGGGSILLQLLQQQNAAQHRLEQAEALRFASQIIGHHVRDASRIMPSSHSSLLEVTVPGAPGSPWVSLACFQTADQHRVQLMYAADSQSLSCKNATTNSPQQILIDKLWPLQFQYGCLAAPGTVTDSRITHTVDSAAACTDGVASVAVTASAPANALGSAQPTATWTVVNRVTFWTHPPP